MHLVLARTRALAHVCQNKKKAAFFRVRRRERTRLLAGVYKWAVGVGVLRGMRRAPAAARTPGGPPLRAMPHKDVEQHAVPEKVRNWALTFLVIGVWAVVGLQIAMVAGGGVEVMYINKQLARADAASAALDDLTADMPDDAAERALQRAMDMFENVYVITGHTRQLLETVDPQRVDTLLERVDDIAERVRLLQDGVSPERIEQTRQQAMRVAEGIERTLSDIDDGKLARLIESTTRIAATVQPEQINDLIASVRALEQRLEQMHELRISF